MRRSRGSAVSNTSEPPTENSHYGQAGSLLCRRCRQPPPWPRGRAPLLCSVAGSSGFPLTPRTVEREAGGGGAAVSILPNLHTSNSGGKGSQSPTFQKLSRLHGSSEANGGLWAELWEEPAVWFTFLTQCMAIHGAFRFVLPNSRFLPN